jgi:hypothetical protein
MVLPRRLSANKYLRFRVGERKPLSNLGLDGEYPLQNQPSATRREGVVGLQYAKPYVLAESTD